jgi:hypothetical protein
MKFLNSRVVRLAIASVLAGVLIGLVGANPSTRPRSGGCWNRRIGALPKVEALAGKQPEFASSIGIFPGRFMVCPPVSAGTP